MIGRISLAKKINVDPIARARTTTTATTTANGSARRGRASAAGSADGEARPRIIEARPIATASSRSLRSSRVFPTFSPPKAEKWEKARCASRASSFRVRFGKRSLH